jgi:hypothetical protein
MACSLRAVLLAGSALVACARPAPPPRAPEPAPVRARAAVTEPSLEIRLGVAEEALAVELVARGLAATVWEVPALSGLALEGLSARDDAGALRTSSTREGAGVRVALGRAPAGTLRLGYRLRPTWEAGASEVPPTLALRIEPGTLLAAGEQALLLPAAPEATPVRVALRVDAASGPHVASTFGVEGAARVRLAELRHAALLAGELGRATFRGRDGEDDFAWAGELRFDARWSAAETAGVRSAVDAWFGAEPGETARFTGLMVVDTSLVADDAAVVVPRAGGLHVALSAGARWGAPVRLAIAQGLVHRWIGGRLRLRAGADDPPEAGAWFDEGFARFVAREVLWSLGTLSAPDYADEVNAHWAAVATAPLRRAGGAEVGRAAADGDASARALQVARGALAASRLDAALRGRGSSLQAVLRRLVDTARRDGVRELPLAALTDLVAEALGPAEVEALRATLAGATPTVPAGALGRCFVRAPHTYVGFDAGLDEDASRAASRVVGVRAGGPAARAGAREGEPMLSLVRGADPTSPLELTVDRGGAPVTLTYRPLGASGKAEAWRRRSGADEHDCPR